MFEERRTRLEEQTATITKDIQCTPGSNPTLRSTLDLFVDWLHQRARHGYNNAEVLASKGAYEAAAKNKVEADHAAEALNYLNATLTVELTHRFDEDTPLKMAYREAADAVYGEEGEIEIDEGAPVSHSPDFGAYVQAWVWIDANEHIPESLHSEAQRYVDEDEDNE